MKDDDCDRPACFETVTAISDALKRIKNKNKVNHLDPSISNSLKTVTCPPSKDFIGKSTWTLLHSMAAWYPENPTKKEQQNMTTLIKAISHFYPCTPCAVDFQENLRQSPARTNSRIELCQWFCEQHNIVNEKLGKSKLKCDMQTLDERWRNNLDPRCDPDME